MDSADENEYCQDDPLGIRLSNNMSDDDWQKNGPLVIGGMGGSGTRLVAEICSLLGWYLGDDLNIASDNLLYTLLFRRRTWFLKAYRQNSSYSTGLSLLEKLILKKFLLNPREIWYLVYAVADMALHYRDERTWAFKRLAALFRKSDFELSDYCGWGWKEPNTYLLIEQMGSHFNNLKFIHTVRHGLDMAFSKNQRQMRAWGELFGIPRPVNTRQIPPASLAYWVRANQAAARQGKKLGKDHYLQISFDQLCRQPHEVINAIISFLNMNPEKEVIQKAVSLPSPPDSLGRYKERDLSQFNPDDLKAVEEFGFLVERRE